MSKGTNRLDAVIKQNELLQEQNELLREQNELLRKAPAPKDDYEIFIDDIEHDEMRSGFLVTSGRKKMWNVQLNMLKEFDRICNKYGIRWFVFYGSLLGAARHKGFVPWDDDIDVMLLRPDFEKFRRVAPLEVKYPYFFDAWTDYRLETEKNFSVTGEENFQLVTTQQEENMAGWWPFWPLLKLRDMRTSMIQWPDRRHIKQGMWLDIFPFDPAPPLSDDRQRTIFALARELLLAAALPKSFRKQLAANKKTLHKPEFLQKLLGTTHYRRTRYFETFMFKNFYKSERIAEFRDLILKPRPDRPNVTYDAKDFEKTVWLPFEKAKVPVPAGYENCLTQNYGDWHKIVVSNIHSMEFSCDISSEEYFKTAMQFVPRQ